jgi:hypothetical protein
MIWHFFGLENLWATFNKLGYFLKSSGHPAWDEEASVPAIEIIVRFVFF